MKRYLFFILSLGSLSSLSAQYIHLREHPFEDPHRYLRAEVVYEDSDRNIWLGTPKGLFRYDGVDYEYFQKRDSSSEYVTAIFQDDRSNMWIGYQDGTICNLLQKTLHPHRKYTEGLDAEITGFAQSHNGYIWIATYGKGIYIFDGDTSRNFSVNDGLSGVDINTLIMDDNGKAYIGTDRGLNICQLVDSEWNVETIGEMDGLPDGIIHAIIQDSVGGFWLGFYNGGICHLDGNTLSISMPIESWSYGTVTSFEILGNQDLWIGTDRSGAVRYDILTGRYSQRSLPTNLKNSKIYDLECDIEGNLWVLDNRVGVTSGSLRFEYFESNYEDIQCLLYTAGGSLLIGTAGGLHLAKNPRQSIAIENSVELVEENITSIYQDTFGHIWVGTFGEGVYIYSNDLANFRQIRNNFNDQGKDNVMTISGIEDDIWLGTLGGALSVKTMADMSSIQYRPSQNHFWGSNLLSNFIYSLYIDRKGQIWFGTDGQGISVFTGDTTIHYPSNSSNLALKDGPTEFGTVYSITEDLRGSIWFSTAKVGVFEFDGTAFHKLSMKEGVAHRGVTALSTTKRGEIVLTHANGIDLLDPETRRLIYYDDAIGIRNFDPPLNSITEELTGALWLADNDQIIRMPHIDREMKIYPAVTLDGLTVEGKDIIHFEQREFSHRDKHFEFAYSTRWFTDPSVVKYSYQMEGYDRNWIETRNNEIVYSSLPPGTYTFKIRATESEFWDNTPIVKYEFEVKSAWWTRWWFVTLSLLILLYSGLIIFRLRERRIKKIAALEKSIIERELQALKAQINPHFLFNSLYGLVDTIHLGSDLAIEYVEKLADFYRAAIQYRDRALIPIQEEIVLLDNFKYILDRRLEDRFKLDVKVGTNLKGFIPPLTLQLLVENAVKHNSATRNLPLHILVCHDGNGHIRVTNPIQRKVDEVRSEKLGLRNLSKRYELLGGYKIKIFQSDKNFSVSIPIIN